MMTSDLMKRLAMVALLATGLSGCASMGTVVDDSDPEAELPNLSMGRSIMEGLGAVPARRTPINYTPRAPLVVPPNTKALETPQEAARLTQDPSWPVDPDAATNQRLRDAAARDAGRDKSDLLPASELLATRAPSATTRVNTQMIPDANRPVLPSQLDRNFKPGSFDNGGLYTVDGTPRRRALTEPPVAYLEPAPGVPVEIPVDPKKKKVGILGMFSSDEPAAGTPATP